MRWNIDAGTSTEMRWNIDVQKNCAGTSTIVVPARFVGVPLRLSVFQILDLVMLTSLGFASCYNYVAFCRHYVAHVAYDNYGRQHD